MPLETSPPHRPAPRRTGQRLLLLGAAVLALHLGVWTALSAPRRTVAPFGENSPTDRASAMNTPTATAPTPAPAFTVRQLAEPAAPHRDTHTPLATAPAAAPVRSPPTEREARRVSRSPLAAQAIGAAPSAPLPEAFTPHTEAEANAAPRHAVYHPGDEAAPQVLTVADGPMDVAAMEPVPVYRTRIPPPLTVRYSMQRGMVHGSGELQWQPQGGRYVARMAGQALGMTLLMWRSEGGFDAAGLAPLRFTDKRLRKSEQAANFQRALGKITYSGPAVEFPLVPGTQDRLSWMVQLAAIAAAEPQRLAAGQRLSVFVSGARGDADVWAFRVLGAERVPTGAGKVNAIKLLREPRKPHDTRVEVWLGPQHQHMPVRVRLSSGADGDALEFVLEEVILSSS